MASVWEEGRTEVVTQMIQPIKQMDTERLTGTLLFTFGERVPDTEDEASMWAGGNAQ